MTQRTLACDVTDDVTDGVTDGVTDDVTDGAKEYPGHAVGVFLVGCDKGSQVGQRTLHTQRFEGLAVSQRRREALSVVPGVYA